MIAIDRYPHRLRLAEERGKAIPINYEKTNVYEALLELTGGRGPDRCIDCVGKEAHGTEIDYAYDKAKQLLRRRVLRQAIRACRKGGTVSVVGVYGGLLDKFPMGAIVNKALTLKSGQQPGQRCAPTLFEHVREGELDPAFLLTHPMSLEDGAQGYELKTDNCLWVVFKP